ncbi:MAG: DotA/TraY family protein [Gammaproteobacteria bacterium]|jgi:hypothetical protein
MMKRMPWLKKAVIQAGLFFGAIVFSASAFADGVVPVNIPSFFAIAHKDISVGILQSIFGHMTGLFDGATPGILNTMFRQFNLAIMILSLFVIVYVVIISIINTAHQGEFLGKKLDSMWVPLRLLAGFCLVVPFPCGYSAIQWIMMWVVLQGVGAADSLWNSVCKYLSNSDNTLMSVSMNQGQFSTNSINESRDLLKVLVAMHLGKGHIEQATFDGGANVGYNFYYYDSYPANPVVLGSIKWPSPTDGDEKTAAISRGMYNMVQSLDKTSQQIVNKTFPKDANGNVDEPNPLLTTLSYLQSQYLDAMEKQQEQHEEESQSKPKDEFWDKASTGGWMAAGMYYYNIANRNNDAAAATTDVMNSDVTGKNIKLDYDKSRIDTDKDSDSFTYVKLIYNDATGADFFSANVSGDGDTSADVNNLLGEKLVQPISKNMDQYDTDKNSTSGAVDPLIYIQVFGYWILTIVTIIWGVVIAGLTAAAVAFTAVSYFVPAISTLYHVGVLLLLPVFGLLAALFGVAMFMAFYIPMIPYIVFTFAAIGWMIAVFETMLAAPMVAIGLADPHAQHEVLGRAEPALQMLANVFLRPSLMIFGLIGGMILARAATGLVFKTFYTVVQTAIYNLNNFVVSAIGLVITLCMLLLIIMAIVNRCFSLIHIIPDRILSWIGWQAQFGQYSQAPEQEIKQGFKSAAGAAGKFGQQAFEGVKRGADSSVSYGAQRGRLVNDWNHNQGWKHLFGGKSEKSSGTGKPDGE